MMRTAIALLVGLLGLTSQMLGASQAPPDVVAKAGALVDQGRAESLRAEQTRDNRAKSAARRHFEDSEKLLKQAVKRHPDCERCSELLVATYFGLGYVGEKDGFESCIDEAKRALARFPANGQIALYKGLAHHYRNEFGDAARALKQYRASAARTAENDEVADATLKTSQEEFLKRWYNQSDFYESGESRITRFNAQTFRNETIFQVTRDYELQLGAQALAAVTQNTQAANDTETTTFLKQLVNRLTSKTPGPAFDYQVRLIDSPEINAMTPPGHILVNTGLLRFVDTEAQLAGILAHELAHNYGHHAARRLIKAYHGQQIGNLVAQAVSGQGATTQLLTQLSSTIALDLFLKAYSRFEEKEADLYGAHLMFNGGYNPTALSSFFLKLYERNARQPIKFLSTHPPTPDRVDYVTEYLESFPLDRELVVDSSDAFKQVKSRYPSTER